MTTPKNLSSRYELGEIIGFGGMSEVHKARDLRLGRDVAIKVLRADLARDPTFYLRFKREAQNAAALNHPAIVAVYDTGEAEIDGGPLPYIVMEYVDGDTLRDLVRGKGPFQPRRAMEVVADVCAALDFSHRNGIVHRDMKPANIMINRAGAVKVMDFGIARAIADSSNPMTQTAAVIGTAQYLSPEQARGEQVDARSDVYSVGCVLYEILTGEPPFTGDSPVAVAYQHVREDPRLPSTVHPGVPRELDSVVLKAMAKNPANRYQTAAEMRADLIRVLGGQKPTAPIIMTDEDRSFDDELPPARSYRTIERRDDTSEQEIVQAEPRRRTALIAGLAAAAVAVVAALLWALVGPGARPDQVTVPDVANKNSQLAQRDLENQGFHVAVQPTPDAKIVQGNVVSTQPLGGSRVDKGSTITVLVSSGPQQVAVPKLAGLTQSQAEQTLTGQGLKLASDVKQAASSSDDKGKVVAQTPDAGQKIDAGAEVTISLGSGPEKVRVPDVVGQTIDVAKPNLEDSSGFTVTTQEVPSNQPKGTVLGTTPAAGTQADKGSTVTVQISTGDQLTMPDLRGMTPAQAADQLRQRGWNGQISQNTMSTLNAGEVGRVLAQQPTAGTSLGKSQTVTITTGVLSLGPP
ncbi:Stk1 family PASTA domain-containing Ser/Thr kinase [Nocardia sp. NBC_00511]|uniref:Stk1 family PASTA domain-containing Ser/Thr kinase n=1 Tax=Nocardia sp. NBC_00511 TaxID=2903591 RepID=UPI0030DEA4CE